MPFFSEIQGLLSIGSVTFLAFILLVLVVYFCLPGSRSRAVLLLIAGAFFFLTISPRMLWVIILVILLAYSFGRLLGLDRSPSAESEQGEEPRQRSSRFLLVLAIVLIAASLLVFKYAPLAASLVTPLLSESQQLTFSPALALVAPIGVSFWTFQALAYVIDIFRGRRAPEKNLLFFSAAVLYIPTVTMGPIAPVQTVVVQLKKKYRFHFEDMRSGLLLMGWGFFKKLMVADALAVVVDAVFKNPHAFGGQKSGFILFAAVVFFAIQLYADFSGYTDIVRGISRLFGVELPQNFRAPYFAHSTAEFWRRWHMTLMDWLKNYIYVPLGGNRKGKLRKQLNVMAVFLVSGIWHGAGLQYVVWGGLNGVWQIVGSALAPVRERIVAITHLKQVPWLRHIVQVLLTCVLITIAWVFFRANSVSDALYILTHMYSSNLQVITDGTLARLGLNPYELITVFCSFVIVWVFDYLIVEKNVPLLQKITSLPLVLRWLLYYGLIFVIVIFGHYGGTYNASDFLYYKF